MNVANDKSRSTLQVSSLLSAGGGWKTHHLVLALFAAAFILNFLFAVFNFVWFSVGLSVLSIAVLSSITGYRVLSFLLVASLPLSVNIELGQTGAFLRMPSELLIVIVSLAYLVRHFFIAAIDPVVWRHPVTRLLVLFMLVQVLSSFFSTMPVISVKAVVIKTLYILAFYLATIELFRSRKKDSVLLYLAYLVPLAGAAIYTMFRHADFGFDKGYAFTAPEPFFSDHTIYSDCLVFILSFLVAFAIESKSWFHSRYLAFPFLLTALFTGAAILLSSSRAAWLSLGVMSLSAVLISLRIKTGYLVMCLVLLTGLSLVNLDAINLALRGNRYDSGIITADLETQAKSITNITNDNSNAERINRWKSALRMSSEKPWTGFGPGTYQFQYLDFQKPEDMTPISVTSPYHAIKGRGGTAHNEFLLVLSESGAIAFALFILLVATVLFTASSTLKRLGQDTIKMKSLFIAVYLGWISYVCHSLFNNFLDTDKAAFLFYSAMAVIVTFDLESNNQRITN